MEPWRHPQSSDAFERRRLYGVHPAIVTNNKDPENRARVKVRFPWLHDSEESWWARVATFYAGKGRGSYLVPEVNDEVLVAFEHGDFHFPYVVGSVWNGVDQVPGPGNPDGENNVKHFESRCGHKLVFDDTAGAEKITLVDSSGNNSIQIDVAADTIAVRAETGSIYIKAPAGKIEISCVDLKMTAQDGGKAVGNSTYDVGGNHTLSTKGQDVNVTATQQITVDTKMEQKTPTMEAEVSGSFQLQSANTKVKLDSLAAQITTTSYTQGTVERSAGEATDEIDSYTLTTTSAQIQAQQAHGHSAGAAHTVNASTLKAEGSGDGVLVEGASVSVSGGMIVFKGSSVMLNGAV